MRKKQVVSWVPGANARLWWLKERFTLEEIIYGWDKVTKPQRGPNIEHAYRAGERNAEASKAVELLAKKLKAKGSKTYMRDAIRKCHQRYGIEASLPAWDATIRKLIRSRTEKKP